MVIPSPSVAPNPAAIAKGGNGAGAQSGEAPFAVTAPQKRRRRNSNSSPKRAKTQAEAAAAAVASAISAGAGAMVHTTPDHSARSGAAGAQVVQSANHAPQQGQQQALGQQGNGQQYAPTTPAGLYNFSPPYDPASAALLMNPHAAAIAASAHAAMVAAAAQHLASQQNQQVAPHATVNANTGAPHAAPTPVPATLSGTTSSSSVSPSNASNFAPTATVMNTHSNNHAQTGQPVVQTPSVVAGVTAGTPSAPNASASSIAQAPNHQAPPPSAPPAQTKLPFSSPASAMLAGAVNSQHPAAILAAALSNPTSALNAVQQHQQSQHQQQLHHQQQQQQQQTQPQQVSYHLPPPAPASRATPVPAAHTHPAGTPGIPPMPPSINGIAGNPTAAVAAAAQAVAAHAAAAMAGGHSVSMGSTNTLFANMQSWKLEQLESHVQRLRESNQPIPQPVALLLADARRKEEKRTAKRVANRKSACTSRARKKALVEEMTRTNARLRRQALILSLLPDLVVAITTHGEITFCSAQVERVLKHKIGDLIGANLSDILVPQSREALRRLVEELVAAEHAATSSGLLTNRNSSKADDNGGGNVSAESSSSAGGNSSSCAVVVSEQSFPLSVVKVKSRGLDKLSGEEETSDLSTANNMKTTASSSNVNKSLSRSTTNSSLGNQSSCGDEDSSPQDAAGALRCEAVSQNTLNSVGQVETGGSKRPAKVPKASLRPLSSGSDESISSSSDVKNLRKASEALNRNVRWHNAKMCKSQSGHMKSSHTDDVTGASVTANNADARLSSLQHRPKLSANKSGASNKAPDRSTSTLTFESLEEQSSSSADSLLAGVEEKKKGVNLTSSSGGANGNENASEDSGYRESSESLPSPEDSASCASDTTSNSRNGRRPRPLAPTCNVCVIRDDLTTIWCEVTSSIRTRSLKEEVVDTTTPATGGAAGSSAEKGASLNPGSNKSSKDIGNSSEDSSPPSDAEEVKELLLCLRPIRDGEEKVGEELRFVPSTKSKPDQQQAGQDASAEQTTAAVVSNGATSGSGNSSPNNVDSGGSTNSAESPNIPMKKRPPRKRPAVGEAALAQASTNINSGLHPNKKRHLSPVAAGSIGHDQATDTEKSVVESLMLMSNNSK